MLGYWRILVVAVCSMRSTQLALAVEARKKKFRGASPGEVSARAYARRKFTVTAVLSRPHQVRAVSGFESVAPAS